MIKAVILDMDGTIVSSSLLIFEAYQVALKAYNITITRKQMEGIRDSKPEELFTAFGLTPEQSVEAVKIQNEYCREHNKRAYVFPGMKELIKFNHDHNLTQAILTGRSSVAAEDLLKEHELTQYFKAVYGSDRVPASKPSPSGLLLIARDFGLKPDEMVYIGDHDNDVRAGLDAGCLTIQAAWREPNPTHPHNETPDYKFTNPQQVIDLLSKLISC